jgi:hypothetical protein
MYNLSLVLTKVSIICQYMRIFTAPKIKKFCRIMIGVLIVYGCWTVIGSAFMCVPVAKFWDITGTGKGHCMNKLAFWFSNAALNITTDIMIFAIPMPLLKQLQLPKKQKIGLMFVFGFGALYVDPSFCSKQSLLTHFQRLRHQRHSLEELVRNICREGHFMYVYIPNIMP